MPMKSQFLAFINEKLNRELNIPYLSKYALRLAINDIQGIDDKYQYFCFIYHKWKINVTELSEKNTLLTLFKEIDEQNIFIPITAFRTEK